VTALLICGPAAASAQSVGGPLGPRSSATIRLSVSIAPRFRLMNAGSVDGALWETGNVTANIPADRYEIVRQPAGPSRDDPTAGERPASSHILYLIVPD
jgi:hypothetical protein